MMDMFKLKIATTFMKGIVTKIIEKKIYKQLGYMVNIQLNDIQIDMEDGDVKIHMDVDGKMNKTEFNRLMKEIEEKF